MLRQGVGRLVGGLEEQGVEAVPHGEHIPLVDAGVAAAALHVVHSVVGEGDLLVQTAVLQHNKSRQHLGDAGGVVGLMQIFSEKDGAGIGVHDDAPVSLDGHVGGPARGGVGGRREEAEGENNGQ